MIWIDHNYQFLLSHIQVRSWVFQLKHFGNIFSLNSNSFFESPCLRSHRDTNAKFQMLYLMSGKKKQQKKKSAKKKSAKPLDELKRAADQGNGLKQISILMFLIAKFKWKAIHVQALIFKQIKKRFISFYSQFYHILLKLSWFDICQDIYSL